jgi:hypothetical protein
LRDALEVHLHGDFPNLNAGIRQVARVADTPIRWQRAMQRVFSLQQRALTKISAVQPQQIERENHGRIFHCCLTDTVRVTKDMTLLQPVPLRAAHVVQNHRRDLVY